MPVSWKERIQPDKSLFENTQFRNGVAAVPASSIAEQFFCEMKVEQGSIHGEIETAAKTQGDILHKQLLGMRRTTVKKLIKNIETLELYVASFPLVSEFQGLVLSGIPDAIVFQKGKPSHLIELKTTGGNPTILYEDQTAQIGVYGLLLDEIGFDCSRLKMVIPKFRRHRRLSPGEKKQFLHFIVSALISKMDFDKSSKQFGNDLVVHSIDYSRENSIRTINFTRGYWLKEREPVPTSNPNKCRVCEFRNLCPSSLAKDSVLL
jgi:hypothetical protein